MCGRFTICVEKKVLIEYLSDNYHIDDISVDLDVPRFNVAPGQNVISIINDGKKNRVGFLKWGYVPPFSTNEKIGYALINAKAETLKEKPMFRASMENRRCVLLADSFYEWNRDKKSKNPTRFTLKNESLFPLAGLWSTYTRPDGTKLHTCTIITTAANEAVSAIHDRMPVILTAENEKIWLDPQNKDLDQLQALLLPYDANKIESYLVSDRVNTASADDSLLIEPLENKK